MMKVGKWIQVLIVAVSLGNVSAQEVPETVFAKWKERVDPSVERALDYLAKVQKEDGSFPEGYGKSAGIPALVGMAMLSRGHMATEGPYAETLTRCIDYILANQDRQGLYEAGYAGSGPMYAHNLSLIHISEPTRPY